MNNLTGIGKRISKLRREKKLTQAELAEKMYIKRELVNMYEKEVRYPKLDDVISLSNLFNVPTDYILGKTGVRSFDLDSQAIHKIIGLSEEVINRLKNWKDTTKELHSFKHLFNTLNALLEDKDLKNLLDEINLYIKSVKHSKYLEIKYPDIDFDENLKIIQELAIQQEYSKETLEQQPLRIYLIQKKFIKFIEKYGKAVQSEIKEQTYLEENQKEVLESLQKFNLSGKIK